MGNRIADPGETLEPDLLLSPDMRAELMGESAQFDIQNIFDALLVHRLRNPQKLSVPIDQFLRRSSIHGNSAERCPRQIRRTSSVLFLAR